MCHESCATQVREVYEETGVRLRNVDDHGREECFSRGLAFPTAFAACDGVTPDGNGRVMFHYAIIEAGN